MKAKLKIIIFFLFSFSACGPAQHDSIIKSAEQNAHNDSLRRKAEKKLETETKQAVSDSLIKIEKGIDSIKLVIGETKAEYQVQLDKLGKIKKFKLLRKKEEREIQIREQSDVLYKLETRISELEYQLVNLQVRLDYYNSELQRHSEN